MSLAGAVSLDNQVRLIADSGAKAVRITAHWDQIEKTRGQYNWTSMDKVIDVLEISGLKALVVLKGTPTWAGNCVTCPPDLGAWSGFVGKIVSRYQSRVMAWEIWNEPNSQTMWSGTVDDYYGLVLTATQAIRTARSSAKIVLGSPTHAAILNEGPWISALLAKPGIGDYFDVLGIHVYGTVGTVDATFASLKRLTGKYGLESKEVWVTETNPQRDSETAQAEALEPWVRSLFDHGATFVFYFTLPNYCQSQTSQKEWCDANVYLTARRTGGLVHILDLSPTLVYRAFQALNGVKQ